MKPSWLFIAGDTTRNILIVVIALVIFGLLLACGLWKQARDEQRKERD